MELYGISGRTLYALNVENIENRVIHFTVPFKNGKIKHAKIRESQFSRSKPCVGVGHILLFLFKTKEEAKEYLINKLNEEVRRAKQSYEDISKSNNKLIDKISKF